MNIERNPVLDVNELNDLLLTQGWDIHPVNRLQDSLDRTWGWLTARDESGRLIGFVRVLSDGIQHAYILHLLVHPDYRKQGIGTALMTELMRFIGEHRLLPTLVATPGNAQFCEKFGFVPEMHGLTAMCIRGNAYWEKYK